MSEGPFSIDDIIANNTDQSPIPVKPKEIIKPSYILLEPHDKSKNLVIIYTGLVLGGTPNRKDKLYKLAETHNDSIEIYTKTGEPLEKGIINKILSDMTGGKRKRKRTKKNKKRKSKKCKSKRRRQK